VVIPPPAAEPQTAPAVAVPGSALDDVFGPAQVVSS
jgi:hypothetical protein